MPKASRFQNIIQTLQDNLDRRWKTLLRFTEPPGVVIAVVVNLAFLLAPYIAIAVLARVAVPSITLELATALGWCALTPPAVARLINAWEPVLDEALKPNLAAFAAMGIYQCLSLTPLLWLFVLAPAINAPYWLTLTVLTGYLVLIEITLRLGNAVTRTKFRDSFESEGAANEH